MRRLPNVTTETDCCAIHHGLPPPPEVLPGVVKIDPSGSVTVDDVAIGAGCHGVQNCLGDIFVDELHTAIGKEDVSTPWVIT